MPYNVNYKADFENTEGQVVTIKIEDRFSGSVFAYNLQFSSIRNPNGTITVTFTFGALPPDATGTLIGYSTDNITYAYDFRGVNSPVSITLPANSYYFKFVVLRPGGDEIYDLFNVAGQTISLKPGADPVHLQVNNNSEDKMNPIAGLQMVMQFNAQDNSLLNALLRGTYSDKRYFITADINGRFIFKGYLNLPDTSEPFMPRPVITFSATDGLGSLKNKKLKDFTGANPTGMHTIAEFIAWCLKMTGVEENFNVIFNLREGTGVMPISYANFSNAGSTIFFPIQHYDQFFAGQRLLCTSAGANNGQVFTVVTNNAGFNIQVTPAPIHESGIVNFTLSDLNDGHFFQKAFLDSKFAEDEVGTSIDCYTVLQNILNKLGTLGQRHGEWWFKNFDEFNFQQDYVSVFNKDGIFLEALPAATYSKEIGNTAGNRKNMKWSQHNATVGFTSPAKMARLVQQFINPKELPCNVDFSRGNIFYDTANVKRYEVSCWSTMKKNLPAPVAGDCTRFIERIFVDGYETERYLVITWPPNSTGGLNYTESEAIVLNKQDRFDYSVEYSWRNNKFKNGNWSFFISMIRLEGADGSHWSLDGAGKWSLSDANWAVQLRFLIENWVPDNVNETETRTVSVSAQPLPVAGKIILMLFALNQHPSETFDNEDVKYNISFEYIPFINNSYQKYSEQHHKVEIIADNNESSDDEVYIDNLPNKILKGALQKFNGSTYIPCGLFWNSAVDPGHPVDYAHMHVFGKIRIFNVWNQVRLLKRIIKGSISGIESDTVDARDKSDLPTLFHTYYLRDTDEHINDKQFMLINYDLDLYRCQFLSAAFKEVFNLAVPNDYDVNNYEFKYVRK